MAIDGQAGNGAVSGPAKVAETLLLVAMRPDAIPVYVSQDSRYVLTSGGQRQPMNLSDGWA